MGACYSKKAGQLAEAYSHPVRAGSPARPRKRSTMNRTAPYSRQPTSTARSSTTSASRAPPGHSFGFKRRSAAAGTSTASSAGGGAASSGGGSSASSGGGRGGHRVQPVPPPAARRTTAALSTSNDSLASTTSDANGNQKAVKRGLPRPLVARVRPRTSVDGSNQGGRLGRTSIGPHTSQGGASTHAAKSNSGSSLNSTQSTKSLSSARSANSANSATPNTNSATQLQSLSRSGKMPEVLSPGEESQHMMEDSGMGTMRGSLSSTASTLSTAETVTPDESQTPNEQQSIPGEEKQDDIDHEPGEIRDFQVGIQTGGATIALSVNIHKGENPSLSRPQVTLMDTTGRARVTRIQRPGFGVPLPAGLTRSGGVVGVAKIGASGGNVGATEQTRTGASGAGAGTIAAGGTTNTGANTSITTNASAGTTHALSTTASGATSINDGTSTNSSATVPPTASNATPRGLSLTIPKPTPPARLMGLEQTVRSRVTRWEEKVDQVRREVTTSTPPFRRNEPSIGTHTNIASLRKEMRQLTRDVATSPLRRPNLRDAGTCTERHVPRGLVDQHVGESPRSTCGVVSPTELFSPVNSGDSPDSRNATSAADVFIDDEIGDQPEFGAFGESGMSPGSVLERVLGGGMRDPPSPPSPALPPLQITEGPTEEYVRPYRLTPRPVTAITALETPLRRWAAEPGSCSSDSDRQVVGRRAAEPGCCGLDVSHQVSLSASERRRLMEERAELLSRRFGVGENTPLGSTYQRLGLPDPASEHKEDMTKEKTDDLAINEQRSSGLGEIAVHASTPLSGEEKEQREGSPEEDIVTPKLDKLQESAENESISREPVDEAKMEISADNEGKDGTPASSATARSAAVSASTEAATPAARGSSWSPESAHSSSFVPCASTTSASMRPAASVTTATSSASATATATTRAASPTSPPTPSACPGPSASLASASGPSWGPTSLPEFTRAEDRTGESRTLWDGGEREEEERAREEDRGQAEVAAGCRARRTSWRRLSELQSVTSPTASLNSDDLMADFDKDFDDALEEEEEEAEMSLPGQVSRVQRMRLRTGSSTDTGGQYPCPGTGSRILRPPRQSSSQDAEDWLLIDRDTYMYMSQDFTHTKTMLHKLRRILQDTETTSPFENSLQSCRRGTSVSSEFQFSPIEGSRVGDGGAALAAENAYLRRQVSALQLTIADQSRTIRLLQEQIGGATGGPPDVTSVGTQATQVVTEDPNVITAGPDRH